MVEPAHVRSAALVALGVDALLRLAVRGDHGSPLPRGQLLVRVEAEHGEVAARAHRRAVGVHGAERLAGVLHHPERALGGDPLERGHVGGVAEDVDGQQPGGALADRALGRHGVDVEGARVDVAEDRPGALVEQAVGRRHEAERRGHDLVPGLHPRGADRQVEAGRSARHRGHVARPQARAERGLELRAAAARATGGPSAASRAPPAPRARRPAGARAGSGRSRHHVRAGPARPRREACRPRASPRAPPSWLR